MSPRAERRARELQSFSLGASGIAKLGIGGFKLGHRFLRGFEPAFKLRQPAPDGLLEHPVRVLLLVQAPFDALKLGVDLRNLDPALIGFDQFACRLVLRLFQRHLDPAKLDGKLGAQLVLVGLDIGRRHGHRHLDPPPGKTHGPLPEGRGDHQRKQARKQKTERHIHANVDHRNLRS